MRVRDVDLAHPPRSYAILLVRLAIACFVPFAPVYLLVVVTGIMGRDVASRLHGIGFHDHS